jgi:hypothetical protein
MLNLWKNQLKKVSKTIHNPGYNNLERLIKEFLDANSFVLLRSQGTKDLFCLKRTDLHS